ncbi:nucleoside phosphatase GDA1/CD39 [Basidiobolus meristosporus CBS 931.73]|uniref:guanosine-diphosphatase n=1 Tax=Basidiobolus meristosporus CBS 931.73 TaxID=1314790 RepID=A0A1Y1ZDY4_9FUNG|nr:nucleoside phosphatase GDA1/CD39 [Basidiobolus meristosporus CBS 931.73]|eukprot:ORY08177.1 nucleoside phosphatase GDA1/CD39 [Basidiobolus meristosporus CBS 931.73]
MTEVKLTKRKRETSEGKSDPSGSPKEVPKNVAEKRTDLSNDRVKPIFLLIIFSFITWFYFTSNPSGCKQEYVSIIDAGSTGSRIHVYTFERCSNEVKLLDELFEQVEPGLSAYSEEPHIAAKSLDPLIDHALKKIPKHLHKCTPITVKATAGLRLLGEEKSAEILKAVEERLVENYPFPLTKDEGVAILDGAKEGVYAWITVNYLLKNIGQEKQKPTVAILDLGGGSTQIVFEPTLSESHEFPEEHQYRLKFGPREHILYQHSHLGYGLMEARKQAKALVAQSSEAHQIVIPHPCLFPRTSQKWEIPTEAGERTLTLVGIATGMEQCHELMYKMLDKSVECPTSPCSFNGIYQPKLTETFTHQEIYIFSYFHDITQRLGFKQNIGLWEIQEANKKICERTFFPELSESEAVKFFMQPDRFHDCLDLSYLFSLLHHAYEIPLDTPLKVAKKIDDIETSWSLGAALTLLDEYSSCKEIDN